MTPINPSLLYLFGDYITPIYQTDNKTVIDKMTDAQMQTHREEINAHQPNLQERDK